MSANDLYGYGPDCCGPDDSAFDAPAERRDRDDGPPRIGGNRRAELVGLLDEYEAALPRWQPAPELGAGALVMKDAEAVNARAVKAQRKLFVNLVPALRSLLQEHEENDRLAALVAERDRELADSQARNAGLLEQIWQLQDGLGEVNGELSTAIEAMRRATDGVWSACGIGGSCNGNLSHPTPLPMDEKCDHCRLAALVAAHDNRRAPAGESAAAAGPWLVVICREGVSEVAPFDDEAEAVEFFERASHQWSDSYLCRATRWPADVHARCAPAPGAPAKGGK